ncbi:dihydrolipoamide acetyltransferase family protein [Aurantimicrobium minutum]|jgi:pyruvate dehydrogenase E2 component (dihydrolipoamide acetyltransferase)|uniref:dihydrolipoamide acetyltransferase family protein n=1 Tax=Aurantimicrobium minutum TaxID=708131 RepID=UPI002473E14E|nr:dihydrolipoamide acetyltransferase family protein [Aurantimicrobium minutum]MDH6240152.1 2-oxoisovalerate dehydrogenase E2 component (dihydrolipoyl transacylase) [Aurantimicrobium minutum]
MTVSKFYLPDVGEGLTEAEIVSWKVKPGDSVAINDILVEIETAKSLVELPSPYEGQVSELLAQEGETVEVGTAIITISSAGDSMLTAPTPTLAQAAMANEVFVTADSEMDGAKDAKDEASGSVLVGYGVGGHAATRRRRGGNAPAPTPPAAPAVVTPTPQAVAPAPVAKRPASLPVTEAVPVIAKPPIRKLAKDLDVNLAEVQATGIAGEITRDDVIRHASQASVFRNIQTPEWPEEREERIPVKGVRKAIATAMVQSAFTAPHVSVFVDVDATRTMEFVKRLKNSPDFAGVKVSPLLILAKAIIWAVRRNPTVNSTWTDKEIIVHRYVNLGVAAATPRGLIVPNVKDSQEMSLLELAQALEKLTLDARDGKTSPADMAGGTITVTNIGVFGMDTGTPILNPGEVGILALGTIKQKPWVVDGEVRPRFVTTLGASFDHRVVDGDVASRFLADVASVVEEPALLLD